MFKDPNLKISVSKSQAEAINTDAINARETQLDQLITEFGGDPSALTIAQRSILMDVLYQYGGGSKKVRNAVKKLVDGGSDHDLLEDVSNPRYPARRLNDKKILDSVMNSFDDARNYVPRRDPLVLDLDGDGIETVGATDAILFDHDGDGRSLSNAFAQE